MKTYPSQGGIYRLFPFSYHCLFLRVSRHLLFLALLFGAMCFRGISPDSALAQEPSVLKPPKSVLSSSLPRLTLNDAISIALEQNYGVRIARNATLIAENNTNGIKGLGAAGMLPTVNLTGGWNESRDNVRQQFFNGNTQERAGARTDRFNTAIQLNWTLFDGLQMFAQRDRLAELQKQSDIALRQAVENTIAQVMTSYTNVVEQNVLLAAQRKSMELSRERLTIAEAKSRIGTASDLDAQNARVDYNADSAAYLRQEAVLINSKTALLQVLGNVQQYNDATFTVEDSLTSNREMALGGLLERLSQRNAALRSASVDNTLAQIAVRQAEAFHLPTLNATANYNFTGLDAEAGVIQTAQSNGLNFGVTAQVNIFNGLNIQRQIENARVSALSAELQFQDLENRLKTSLLQTIRIYSNSRTLVQLEQENTRIAKKAAQVALERFRLGSMSSLDLRVVQQNYVRAESRLITALADAKRAEVEIMRLVGDLTKE
jgi:outer membrane protein TolC